VASLRIGDVELKAPITALCGDSAGVFTANNDAWIGNIGGEILRRFTVIFDYQAKRMTLEPNASVADPFEADMSGLSITAQTGPSHLIVDFVVPSSPASEAGVSAGDSLVTINGISVTHPACWRGGS
jgi:predicted metalloprotease with PDZ domain